MCQVSHKSVDINTNVLFQMLNDGVNEFWLVPKFEIITCFLQNKLCMCVFGCVFAYDFVCELTEDNSP